MINKLLGPVALLAIGGVLGSVLTQPAEPIIHQDSNDNVAQHIKSAQHDEQWSFWPSSSHTIAKQVQQPSKINVNDTIKAIVAKQTQFEQFAAAYPVALRANESQLGKLIEALLVLESSQSDSIGIVRIFYVRYVNLNPIDATEHFWHNVAQTSSQYRRVMFNIYHEWAWVDMQSTLDDIKTNVVQKHRESLITYLLGDDHFTNNEILLSVAEQYSERTRAVALLAAVSRESNEIAFEHIIALPLNSDARRHGLFRLVRKWAREDPQAVLSRLKTLTSNRDRSSLIQSAISIWAETEPESALGAAMNIKDGNDYAYAALATLAKKDGVRALALAELHIDKLGPTIKSQVMQTWASKDPRAVAAYIENKGDKNLSSDARQIAWHYTSQYPEEAYQWAQRVGLLDDANVASNMGSALVQADLGKAETLFADLPPSASRNGLFINIVRQRSKVDIAQTHQWLAQYKDEAKFAEAQNNLLYDWARRDPQESASVVAAMENNANKVGHMSTIASNWYDRSPQSALQWLFELPEGTMRDKTLSSLANKLRRTDIEQAESIIAEISNERLQQVMLKALYSRSQ